MCIRDRSPDAVPAQGTIEIQVRGIPADDATAISGQYLLDGNGTIRMPPLPPGHDVLRVVGKTARQIEDMLMAAYKKAELYTAPTFLEMCIRDRRWALPIIRPCTKFWMR